MNTFSYDRARQIQADRLDQAARYRLGRESRKTRRRAMRGGDVIPFPSRPRPPLDLHEQEAS